MFQKTGLTIEEILTIEEHEKSFTNFLLDIQNDYRIQRAMGPDDGNQLLYGAYAIDDILSRIKNLKEAREEYFEKKKQEEQEKIKNQIK